MTENNTPENENTEPANDSSETPTPEGFKDAVEEDCTCPPGWPGCHKATLEDVVKYLQEMNIRVLFDPADEAPKEGEKDGREPFIAANDVRIALSSTLRLQELGNQRAGADPLSMEVIQNLAMAVVNNLGQVLMNKDNYVDLAAQAVPDTIPTDWK